MARTSGRSGSALSRMAARAMVAGLGVAAIAAAAAFGVAGMQRAVAAPVMQPVGTPVIVAPPAVETPVIAPPGLPTADIVSLTTRDIFFDPGALAIPANRNVRLEVTNAGAAMHNFSITDHNNPGLPDLGVFIDLDPGQTDDAIVNALPGTYYFFCDEPGHEAAGMFGYLTVQ